MTTQNLTIRFPAPFPSTVAGNGGIAVSKENGVWIVEPDFSALGEILPAALVDPTAKQVWVFDPITESYNVLTLGGLGEALYKATSTTNVAISAGSKTFVTQSGKDFALGSYVLATSGTNPSNYMLGQITAYAGTSLTISVAASGIGGSGTYADWTLRASSPTGAQGAPGPGYAASSTTSLAIGTGSKAFTTQAALAYTVGARVRASSAANGANYMEGLVTGYSGTTLTVNVTRTGGSGTLSDWNVNLAGDPGAGDLIAANNLSDLASPKTGYDNLSVRGADIASTSTVNLDSATGNLVDITGTTTITAITLADGRERTVRFTGALTLTNGASLVLPHARNIVTAAGDLARFRGYSGGVVRLVAYTFVGQPPQLINGTVIRNENIANEGGQFALELPTSGSSLAGNVNFDLLQNSIRFFEGGGTSRGYYIDISLGGAGASGKILTNKDTAQLDKGFNVTPFSAGTKSSGTFIPDPASGNFQYATNGGAHTIAPPASACTMVVEYTNSGSAGAVTTSSFTKVTGDAITTTNGSKFFFFITKHQNYSHLHVQALQ